LQDLHNQVLRQHGAKCIAACKALAAQRNDSSAGAPDAFRLMMDLNKAKKSLDEAVSELKSMKERADKVNKESLKLQKLVEGAEKTRHEAEKEVILLQAQLNPKRARIDADVLEEDEIENVGDWTLADHRREASRVQNRRNEKIGLRMSRYTYVQVITGFLNLVKPLMARVASLPSPSHRANQEGMGWSTRARASTMEIELSR
jgi:DNA-binding protein YbaB